MVESGVKHHSPTLYSIRTTKLRMPSQPMGRRGRDHMVVGFTATYAISACHH